MYEVTIPLRPVKENEVGLPEDYFKIIREEYASRYLDLLSIASTPANKADFMRYRMMDDCDMRGVWPDLRTSALADAIRIVPPLRQRIGDLVDISEAEKKQWAQWYGHADPICIRPPHIGASHGPTKLDTEEDERKAIAAETAAATSFFDRDAAKPEAAPLSSTSGELAAELERVRNGGPGTPRICKGLSAANFSRLDTERTERMQQELVSLKAKFVFPFACERPAREGSLSGPSRKAELVLWPMEGPLHIDAPTEMWEEVLQPIRITFEDVQRNTAKWVEETMPLEFLTSRKDEALQEEVRGMLKEPDVARLIGLLGHLLQWVALMPARADGPQISDSALQSLFVAIHKHWSQFEKIYRDSKAGVSFALPCLMLTLKRGIDRSFEISYPTLMSNESLRQNVIDRINTLLMRFFDPDCMYTRFGKFDGEGKAILLSKKLEALMAREGTSHVKRLHGRMHRSTPLVRAVLGLIGTGNGTGLVSDTKTRVMMLHNDLGGTVPSGSVVKPPRDVERQAALFEAAMDRLPFQGQHEGAPASARQPPGAKRREAKPRSPRSSRGVAPGFGGETALPSAGCGGVGLEAKPPLAGTMASGLAGQPPALAAGMQAKVGGKRIGDAGVSCAPARSDASTNARAKTQLPRLRSARSQHGA